MDNFPHSFTSHFPLRNLYWSYDKLLSTEIVYDSSATSIYCYILLWHYLLQPLLMWYQEIYDIFQNNFTTHSPKLT